MKNTKETMQKQDYENSSSAPSTSTASLTPSTEAALEPTLQSQPSQIAPPTKTVGDPSFGGILGEIEALSEAEQVSLVTCETVIQAGWQSFVQVGLALGQIRDQRLYRTEFDTFETYCRMRWQYGRHYVNRMISAGQAFTHLVTNCLQRPEHESQIRPLIGLAPDQAQLAWECAVQFAGNGRVTARLVKRAVQELGLRTPPSVVDAGPTKSELRTLVQECLGDLMKLLTQKAPHQVLMEKVEVLHGHVQRLIAVRPRTQPAAGTN